MAGLFKQPKRKLKKLVRDGEYVDAIAFGKSLEPDYSDDSDFMFIMGSIYFIVDDAKKALPYFEKSFELNPNDAEDRNEDRNSDGFTNLEEYVNSLTQK